MRRSASRDHIFLKFSPTSGPKPRNMLVDTRAPTYRSGRASDASVLARGMIDMDGLVAAPTGVVVGVSSVEQPGACVHGVDSFLPVGGQRHERLRGFAFAFLKGEP